MLTYSKTAKHKKHNQRCSMLEPITFDPDINDDINQCNCNRLNKKIAYVQRPEALASVE